MNKISSFIQPTDRPQASDFTMVTIRFHFHNHTDDGDSSSVEDDYLYHIRVLAWVVDLWFCGIGKFKFHSQLNILEIAHMHVLVSFPSKLHAHIRVLYLPG